MNRRQFTRLLGTGTLGLAGSAALGYTAQRPEGAPLASKNWAWMSGERDSRDEWKAQFAQMRAAGVDAVLLQKDREALRRLLPAARNEGLEVHAWVVTMMRGEMEDEHPDWYAVNRKGISTAEDAPYVDYYKFMSPCVEAVQEYTVRRMRRLAKIEGLEGIHLDYIRFPDVILPVALQPKYDLDQDHEMPRFDYGYHPACRALFKEQAGTDPMTLSDPAQNEEWVQFRYDRITHVVEQVAEVVHKEDKMLSAAVFPTPDIARTLVRQDWPNWPLDAVMPMMYHNFYEKPVSWIEAATRQGKEALGGRTSIYSGLFVPELTPKQLTEAIAHARSGGAAGISLFNVEAMTERHWRRLKATLSHE